METLLPGLTSSPNVHPMFVHFPIAFWIAALGFWLLAVWRRNEDLFRVGRWLLYLGTLAGAATVATGFLATAAMGHETPGHDLIHTHRNFMVIATILAAITAGAAFLGRHHTTRGARRLQLGLMAITVLVTLLGADRGAMLVFRHGIGTRHDAAPPSHHESGEEADHEDHEEPAPHEHR